MDETITRRKLTTADGLILAALAGLLFCVYLLTASLTFISDDELYIFDTTESIARHFNLYLGETADLMWPGESPVEPVMPILTAPIYWLANGFDGIGNAHATLLFNPLITALTAALVYLYLRQLAYEKLTAVVGAFTFGLATIAWPYTKTFFRESLFTFALFATAYCLLRWRDAVAEAQRTAPAWLTLTLVPLILNIFSKESSLFSTPVLLLILAPLFSTLRRNRSEWIRLGVFVGIAAVLLVVGFWIFDRYFNSGRFDIWPRLVQMAENADVAWQGVVGFLFSPGKSLFLFSPPIILALGAPFIGERSRRFDAGWPLVLLAVFVLMYAFVRGELWWGGTNWGPRYMVPVTPFLIVAAAPAIDAALRSKNALSKIGLAALFLFGAAVQIGGVSIQLSDYYDWIASIRPGGAWTIGLWEPYYSAVFSHWRMLGAKPPEFAWVQALTGGPAWTVPALVSGLAAVFSGAIIYGLIRESVRRRLMWSAALVGFLTTGAATWLGLHAIYYDQRYQGDVDALHQMNAALNASIDQLADPVILLNNRTYFRFMLNFYKGPAPWYTLALNPNDLLQPDQQRPPPSTDPITLLDQQSTGKSIFAVANCFGRLHKPGEDELCEHRDHGDLILLNEHGPFTPESPRPLEWWFSRQFYYKGVQEFGLTVRLVQFSTVAPAPPLSQPAEHSADYQLGDSIKLIGWDALPDGASLRPGEVLNVSTQWQSLTAPGVDFKIGTYVMSPEGSVIAQDDSLPMNSFWPTSAWQPGDVVRHNIALTLPKDLPPGFYDVWTLMYSPVDGARLPVQDSSDTTIRDHITLFTVEVTR
ncbi:MAG TPA: phospholipid carrier-dependent glycosyltransferase [Anaerolineales bacterium]|nr:phospholipid carrier-dependent glycosyltransferase [Anaerolineales bacterium]